MVEHKEHIEPFINCILELFPKEKNVRAYYVGGCLRSILFPSFSDPLEDWDILLLADDRSILISELNRILCALKKIYIVSERENLNPDYTNCKWYYIPPFTNLKFKIDFILKWDNEDLDFYSNNLKMEVGNENVVSLVNKNTYNIPDVFNLIITKKLILNYFHRDVMFQNTKKTIHIWKRAMKYMKRNWTLSNEISKLFPKFCSHEEILEPNQICPISHEPLNTISHILKFKCGHSFGAESVFQLFLTNLHNEYNCNLCNEHIEHIRCPICRCFITLKNLTES